MNYEEAIKSAIKHTNEALYRWKDNKGIKQFNYLDIHSLLKSCLTRELKGFNTKDVYSKKFISRKNTLLGQLYYYGKPLLELDEHNISKIQFNDFDNFLVKIINNLDLKELYYTPNQEVKTEFTSNLLNINFEEIKQIKF